MKRWLLPFAFLASLEASAATPVTFMAALDLITAKHLEPQKARASWDSSRALSWPTRLHLLPSVSISGSYNNAHNDADAIPNTRYRLGSLETGISLFRFGADSAAATASLADIDVKAARVAESELTAEREAVVALSGLISAQAEEAVYRRLVDVQDKGFKTGEERFKRGLLPKQELDKVEIDLESARARWMDAQNQVLAAQAEIQALSGEHLEIAAEWPWKQTLGNYKAPETRSLAELPRWQEAIAQQEQAEALDRKATRSLWPELQAVYSWNRLQQTHPTPVSSSMNWTAGLVLNWTLFDRLGRISEMRSRNALVSYAHLQAEQTRRALESEWERSRLQFQRSQESARRRETILLQARRLYDLNFERFKAGHSSVNDLAVDQKRLAEAELLVVEGWREAHRDFVLLCHAQGRKVAQCASF